MPVSTSLIEREPDLQIEAHGCRQVFPKRAGNETKWFWFVARP